MRSLYEAITNLTALLTTACCLLRTPAHLSFAAYYLLLATIYYWLTTHYTPRNTHWPLPTTHSLQIMADYLYEYFITYYQHAIVKIFQDATCSTLHTTHC